MNARDVVAIPNWLENGVGKPQHHDVLDCFLAEVVVDAEDLIFLPTGLNHLVQGLCAAVIAPKGLFDHNATAFGILQKPRIGQGTTTACIEIGRDREVKGAIAAGGALLINQFKAAPESHHILWFLQVDGFVEQLADELLPRCWIFFNPGGECFGHLSPKHFIGPRATGATQKSEFTGKSALFEQFEQRRDKFAVS